MKQVFAIFSSLAPPMDLILYIMIVLNVFQHLTTLPDYEGSFKCHKYAFLNDPKRQKRGFWPFSGLRSVQSTWYCILWWNQMFSNIRQLYQVMKDHSKVTEMPLWMIQSAKKRHLWPFYGLRSVGSTWYCILWWKQMFFNIWHRYEVMKDDSKITEMHFWTTHRGKKEVYGHFL